MKKVNYILFAAFAGLLAFSCSKEVDQTVPGALENTIHFRAIANGALDSRTAVLEDESFIKWLETDELKVVEMLEYTVGEEQRTANYSGKATVYSLSDNDKMAVFDATVSGGIPEGATITSAKYVAAFPKENNLDQGGSTESKFWRVSMPATQNPEMGSFDPKADILLSAPASKEDNSRVAEGDDLGFRFHRIGTAVKMTVKGLTSDEKLQKIVITAPVNIAGYVKVDMTNGDYLEGDKTPYASGSKVLTLKFNDLVIDGNLDVWFRVLAADWSGTLEMTAETDKASYYRTAAKESAISLSSPMVFADGGLTKFSVNLGRVRVPKESGTVYAKVKEDNEIGEGASYIVAYASGTTATVMAPIPSGQKYAGAVADIAVSNEAITIQNEEVQVISFEAAKNEGEFYVKFGEQYLSCTASNATLALSDNKREDGYDIWSVSAAGIVNTHAKNSNDVPFELRFNSSANPKRFANYAGTQNAITLFKNGEIHTVPAIIAPANVTVGYKGVEAEALSYELKNLEGTVDVTYDGEVVTEAVDMEDGTIAYTVSRNAVNYEDSDNEAREGWIKITVGEVSTTVTVYQNAAPANVLTVGGLIDGKVYLGANAGDQTTITVTSNYEWHIDWDFDFYVDGIDESFTPLINHGNEGDEENNVSEAVFRADLTNDSTEDRFLGQIGLYRNCDYMGLQNIQVWQRGKAATPAPAGSGSWDDPYNAAAALEEIAKLADNASSEEVFVSGTISKIDEISASYGNATYHITSGNTTVEVFRGKYFNGVNFTAEDQLEIGDVVTVYGKLQKYVKDGTTTPEIAQGNILFTLNGETHMMAPTVSAEVDNDNKTISISWNSVAAATSYDVTCGTQTKTGLTSTTCSFTVTDYGKYDITVTAKAAGLTSVEGTTSATLTDPSSSSPAPETIVFADLNLENGVQYLDPFNGGSFTITFAGGANDGKYYDTGAGIRVYGGGSLTVASTYTIASIEFTWDGSNAPTSDVASPTGYSTSTKTWTGEAKSITLTRPSGSGHWRLKKVTVTYK